MILAVRRHALNLPTLRWVLSAGFVQNLVIVTDWSGWRGWQWGDFNRVVLCYGLFGCALFAWTLAGTMLLRVRDDRLIVVTVFKRSELRLADCTFGLQRVGGRKRGSFYRILVRDGRYTRTVAAWYFPMEWLARRAVSRLERNLFSDT